MSKLSYKNQFKIFVTGMIFTLLSGAGTFSPNCFAQDEKTIRERLENIVVSEDPSDETFSFLSSVLNKPILNLGLRVEAAALLMDEAFGERRFRNLPQLDALWTEAAEVEDPYNEFIPYHNSCEGNVFEHFFSCELYNDPQHVELEYLLGLYEGAELAVRMAEIGIDTLDYPTSFIDLEQILSQISQKERDQLGDDSTIARLLKVMNSSRVDSTTISELEPFIEQLDSISIEEREIASRHIRERYKKQPALGFHLKKTAEIEGISPEVRARIHDILNLTKMPLRSLLK